MKPRLLDVSLIIVGDGPEAELLLQRRREAGGRVCLLHTNRQPTSAPEDGKDKHEKEDTGKEEHEEPMFEVNLGWEEFKENEVQEVYEEPMFEANLVWAEFEEKAVQEEHEEQEPRKEAGKELEEPVFQEETFVWQPPQYRAARSAAARKLQRLYGCTQRGLIRIGPDIVELEDGQWYELLRDDHGRATGVRVLYAKQGERQFIAWQLSGVVLLADGLDAGRKAGSPESGPEHLALARAADVRVICEDAKPVMILNYGTALSSSAWFLCVMTIFYLTAVYFEPELVPGQFAWWRPLTCPWVLHVLPLQMHPLLSRCFLGFAPTKDALPVRVAALTTYVLGLIPPMYMLGGYYHLPYFLTLMLIMESWTLVELYLMHRAHEPNTSIKHPGFSQHFPKPKDVKRQLLFTMAMAWSRTLCQGAMWLITLIYGILEPINSAAAGLFLTTTTSLAENLMVATVQLAYGKLVWQPRVDPESKQVVNGDQIEAPSALISFAHGLCESLRMTNLVAVAAKAGVWRWSWLGTVCMIFVGNVCQRQGLHTYVLALVLPKRFLRLIRPGCVVMIHRHARFFAGYWRFLGALAFVVFNALGRQVIPGRSAALLFNDQALILVGILFVFEVLEDLVVAANIFPLDPWWGRMAALYEGLHTLDLKQLLCKDSRGVSNKTPLRLHGARYLSSGVHRMLIETGALMLNVFIWLPLGIGFAFGICPGPLPSELRVLDAVVWTTPWRCT